MVTLARTDAAPEAARGVAKLEVGHRGDPTSKRIELDTFNLAPGTGARRAMQRERERLRESLNSQSNGFFAIELTGSV